MKRWATGILCVFFLLGITACSKTLVGTTITCSFSEGGAPAGVDFPGADVALCRGGKVVQSATVPPGQSSWKLTCEPGEYDVSINSTGRTMTQTVDVTSGQKRIDFDFDKIVIYGDVKLDGRVLIKDVSADLLATIVLTQDGQVIDQAEMTDSSFGFIVPPGVYDLRIITPRREAVFKIVATLSRKAHLDLARTARISVNIREAGTLPREWPGGVLRVETQSGQTVALLDITEPDLEIQVGNGLYRLVAESAGRTVSSEVMDLSEITQASCTLNFPDVVLFGSLLSEDTEVSEGAIRVLTNGRQVSLCGISVSDCSYGVRVFPGIYDVELIVPSTGGMVRHTVDLTTGSRRLNLNLTKKVVISGHVTENGRLPDPAAFPAGTVTLRTTDGLPKETAPLKQDGSFELTTYAGEYLLKAVSEGRETLRKVDATRGRAEVELDYHELVFTGVLRMGESPLPDSFPVTDVVMVDESGQRIGAGVVEAKSGFFRAVVESGRYSVQLSLRGSPVVVVIPLVEALGRSTQKELDIGHKIAHLHGRVGVKGAAPSSKTVVQLFARGMEKPYMSAPCDSSYCYDLYCTPNTYDLQIEGSKYVSRRYNDIYIGEGESERDLEFTQCVVTYRFTLTTGLFNTPALFNVCINDWCYKVGDNRDNIVHKFVYPRGPVPAYSQVQWEVPVTLDIGTTYYMLVFGVDVGSVKKWTITPTEGQTVEMTVPLLLGS